MPIRIISLTLVVLSAAISQASYDLVMVADYGNSRISRFDGTSGIYLGSFGESRVGSVMAVAADASTGLAYTTGIEGYIQMFDYSTGVFLGDFSSGASSAYSLYRSGTNLYVGTSSGVKQFTTSGVFVRTIGTIGTNYTDVHVGSDGNIFTFNYNLARMEKYTPTGASLGNFALGLTDPSSVPRWQGVGLAGTGYALNSSTDQIERYSESTFAGGAVISSGTKIDRPTGIAFGHGASLYLTGQVPGDSTKSQIVGYSITSGLYSPVFGSGVLKDVRGMTTVIAPEPASMIAVSIGVGVLARRRRKA